MKEQIIAALAAERLRLVSWSYSPPEEPEIITEWWEVVGDAHDGHTVTTVLTDDWESWGCSCGKGE